MKAHGDIRLGNRKYRKGDSLPKAFVYPFFLLHMLLFGASGFFMAYADRGPDLAFVYAHGGIAIFVYVIFYLAIFGADQVRWMFINAGLGLFGIYAQLGWILSLFGKNVGDFPLSRHVTPFLYYVLYTFLLYQLVLDLTGSREDPERRRMVEWAYVLLSLAIYGYIYLG